MTIIVASIPKSKETVIALIDGDIVNFRIGFTTNDSEWWVAKARLEEMLDRILAETGVDEYVVYLSDKTKNNFRSAFYPDYKANRRGRPLPTHYQALRELLIESYGAIITLDQEADDALGIDQTRLGNGRIWADGGAESIICSIDKDLLQIPGTHYNFVRQEFYEVTEAEGRYNFYKQLLTGDAGDNVRGLRGIGDKRASRILQDSNIESDDSLFGLALKQYEAYHAQQWKVDALDSEQTRQVLNLMLVTGRVLKIRRMEGELWNFPELYTELQPLMEPLVSSTLSTPGVTIPFTEPITTA